MRQIPEDDLGQVLRSVAKGDRAAFRRLYEQAGPTLFGTCSRILRDRNAAEDAFQEAMLRVWQRSYLYDPARGGAMNWMVTVVRRVALETKALLGMVVRLPPVLHLTKIPAPPPPSEWAATKE